MSAFESCASRLAELAKWYSAQAGDRNEATTRLHLIDELFIGCLNWPKGDVCAEESHGGLFMDYVFRINQKVMVVEAKKEGMYFEVPAGKLKLEYSLPALSKGNDGLQTAVSQVAHYCQLLGVPLAVVTNGHQLVAFVASRNDGLAPLEGRALVFTSLDLMSEHFLDLWNTLSREAVHERRLQSRLTGSTLQELPPKLSESIHGYPGVKTRSELQTDLQIVSELVIEDLAKDRALETEFLRECYCESGALSQHSLMSKRILETRYASMFPKDGTVTAVPAVTRKGVSDDLVGRSIGKRPILLIGDVGVGKTTFVRHLIKVVAPEVFESGITFYVDFGSQATMDPDIASFVPVEMQRQLRDDYGVDIEEATFVRSVYHGDLQRFQRSVAGGIREIDEKAYLVEELRFLQSLTQDTNNHLRRSLEHIERSHRKQIILFLDNLDQRDEGTQEKAFLIAHEFATHWPAAVFLALRPETFYRSSRIGALTGYHPKAFTISPPRIDRVVRKRLEFGQKLTRGEIAITSLPSGVKINLSTIDELMSAFVNSLESSTDLAEFIDNIAGGNVRAALDLVKEFFGSAHVEPEKVIDRYRASKRPVRTHDFISAVLLGESEYYDPGRSPLCNLFDIEFCIPSDHFSLPLMLGGCEALARKKSVDGFVEAVDVYEKLQAFGLIPEQVDLAIVRAFRRGLIETGGRRIPEPGGEMPDTLRMTSVGAYHVARLCRRFIYLDAIAVDLPILREDVRQQVGEVHSWEARLLRGQAIRSYLDEYWRALQERNARQLFDWDGVSADLNAEMGAVSRRTVELGLP